MSTPLIELVKPYIESINLEEAAGHLKVGVEDILKSEFWAFALISDQLSVTSYQLPSNRQ